MPALMPASTPGAGPLFACPVRSRRLFPQTAALLSRLVCSLGFPFASVIRLRAAAEPEGPAAVAGAALLDEAVAIARAAVVVGVVVAAVVLGDAVVVVMVVSGARSRHRGRADDPQDGERSGDSSLRLLSLIGSFQVRKLEMARAIAGPCPGQSSGGAAPTITVVPLAPATMQAISR